MKSNRDKLLIITYIKIAIIALVIVAFNVMNHSYAHLVSELVELAVIVLVVQLPIKFLKYPFYILSSLLFVIIMAQEGVKVFSGTFTTKTMLENMNNIHALGPSLPKYVVLTVLVIVIAFFPMRFNQLKHHRWLSLGALGLIILGIGAIFVIKANTALVASYSVAQDYRKDYEVEHAMDAVNHKKVLQRFRKTDVKSGINKKLDKMNVIVIFAEGTSRRVLEDKAYPNLMPGINQFAKESIDVRNYYNHTAPTYRGTRGQLYSSFQFTEGYEGAKNAQQMKKRLDTKLIGLPEILNQHGYTTKMINPEPKHTQFTPYLQNLGFDSVISGDSSQWEGTGAGTYLPDKANLNLLFDQANQLNQKKKRFMLTTYTLQTHNGWDTDDTYQDGDNPVLNKFHNFDQAFSDFYTKFKKSSLKSNTILILTTDHATYPSPEYLSTFHEKRSAFVSTVPLMIKYPNSKPDKKDVKGRNSLLLAPTVLDMLNIEKGENYFLGTSLFTNEPSKYEHITEIGSSFYKTKNGVKALTDDDHSTIVDIYNFDAVSLNMKKIEGE